MKNSITLAILSGGKASRMGGADKALVKVEGKPIIIRIYECLSSLFDEIIIISNTPGAEYPIPVDIYPDILKNSCPLSGLHAALVHSTNGHVFVVPSDLPFPDKKIAQKIIASYLSLLPTAKIFIPRINDLAEPLFGIYSKQILPKVEEILSDGSGHSMAELHRSCETFYLDLPPTPSSRMAFFNINTPSDLISLSKSKQPKQIG